MVSVGHIGSSCLTVVGSKMSKSLPGVWCIELASVQFDDILYKCAVGRVKHDAVLHICYMSFSCIL